MGLMLGPSPSKHLGALPVPDISGSPSRRRGHAHRRSTAISGHDLASILQPRDANVRPQTAIPQTPTESISQPQYPSPTKSMSEERNSSESVTTVLSSTEPLVEEPVARPPSRPRVGFSEKIEFIPRPLSTVSADTASTASTVRGHSVGNSMSSLISLGGIGNPSPRRTMITIPDLVSEVSPRSMSAITSDAMVAEPLVSKSPPTFNLPSNSLSFAPGPAIEVPRLSKKKTFLKLDRRRSEPLISLTASADIGTSTISLQEPVACDDSQIPARRSEAVEQGLHRESSRKRVKKWATSILGRKAKDAKKAKQPADASESESGEQTPDLGPQLADPFGEEPDLDALFGQDPFTDADDFASPSILSPQSEMSDSFFPFLSPSSRGGDDTSPVIDLDAALGPYGTPTMSWEESRPATKRRQLHSSRLARDFTGPGMHYHRRTESAPALVPFEFAGRASSPGQSPMDDVFEEEEDEAPVEAAREPSICDTSSQTDEELGTGIQIVDAANTQLEPNFDWSFEDGLGIESHGSLRGAQTLDHSQRQSTPPRTSLVEDTIIEEPMSAETVADHEEPRTSSLTKSSESSGARTISAEDTGLGLPASNNGPLTPTSNIVSTFSSPDLGHNQGSFDALRLGTSASSIADIRTMSSFTTAEPTPEMYMSADDVPSLTSSRSTMISTMYQTSPRRETMERPVSVACGNGQADVQASERRRKRSSIQSLSMLLGGPFGESRNSLRNEQRPQTAIAPSVHQDSKRKKENRLSKLMFWRSKSDSRTNPFQTK